MITIAHESPGEFVSGSAGNALDLGDQLCMSEIDVAFDDSASGTERVIAAAGAVESLEWKLDRARAGLAEAIERAASEGCPVDAIAVAAGMTHEDITSLLWAPCMELPESEA